MDFKMNNKITVNSHFTDINVAITRELRNAKERIWICVAWVTFKAYEKLLLEKISQGIEVKVLCNSDFINYRGTKDINPSLLKRVKFVRNPINGKLVHHKFCIIDDSILINGSFNWSLSAQYHYENILIIKNDYKTINKYKHEFCDLDYMAIQSSLNIEFPKVTRNTSKFTLGMISESHGIYENVTLQQWDVDLNSDICHKLGSIDIHHFNYITSTGLEDIDDDNSKEFYIEQFNRERTKMDDIQKYFEIKGIKVHAIGRAVKSQEWKYDDEEPLIHITWVDVRFRKVVPDVIYVNGGFETVFDEAYFAGC